MRYVALLRGVNAGGNNRVPRAEFQAVLESLGFYDVIIYINSGNAVFSSDTKPSAGKVQQALEAHFGFSIPTLLLTGEKVKAIAAAIPSTWTNDPLKPDKSGQRSDVIYLFDEINTPDILTMVGYRPGVETMLYVDGAILANVTRANQSRYSLVKVIGKPIYKQMTVRNCTTARKLAELVDGTH